MTDPNITTIRKSLQTGRWPSYALPALDAIERTIADLRDENERLHGVHVSLTQALDSLSDKLDATEERLREATEALWEIDACEQRRYEAQWGLDQVEEAWRQRLDEACEYDDEGAHVGLARHARSVAEGLGEALKVIRAALAKVEGDDRG